MPKVGSLVVARVMEDYRGHCRWSQIATTPVRIHAKDIRVGSQSQEIPDLGMMTISHSKAPVTGHAETQIEISTAVKLRAS